MCVYNYKLAVIYTCPCSYCAYSACLQVCAVKGLGWVHIKFDNFDVFAVKRGMVVRGKNDRYKKNQFVKVEIKSFTEYGIVSVIGKGCFPCPVIPVLFDKANGVSHTHTHKKLHIL